MTCTMMMSPLKLLNFHLLSQKERVPLPAITLAIGQLRFERWRMCRSCQNRRRLQILFRRECQMKGIKPVIQLPDRKKYLRIKGMNKSLLLRSMRTQRNMNRNLPVTQQRPARKGRRRWMPGLRKQQIQQK